MNIQNYGFIESACRCASVWQRFRVMWGEWENSVISKSTCCCCFYYLDAFRLIVKEHGECYSVCGMCQSEYCCDRLNRRMILSIIFIVINRNKAFSSIHKLLFLGKFSKKNGTKPNMMRQSIWQDLWWFFPFSHRHHAKQKPKIR